MAKINVRRLLRDAKEIAYLDDAQTFMDTYDFPRDLIETAVRNPDELSWDPNTAENKYPILRIRKGDLTLSVSIKDTNKPFVMYIHLNYPEENRISYGGSRKTSGVSGSNKPKTPLEQQAWFRAHGCKLSNAASGVKVTFQGHLVGMIHLTAHTRGGSPLSSFQMLAKNLREIQSKLAQESIIASVQAENDAV